MIEGISLRTVVLSIYVSFALAGCWGGAQNSGKIAEGTLKFPLSAPSLYPVDVVPALSISFDHPVHVAIPAGEDSRLFVLEGVGGPDRIRIVSDDEVESTFFTLSDVTSPELVGSNLRALALDPNFASNGYFYVSYISEDESELIVARFGTSDDPDVADPESGTKVIGIPFDTGYEGHEGGMIGFGPDGYLYISSGDGNPLDPGLPDLAQDLSSLRGKILRIDPNGGDPYAIPADNPFVGGSERGEIWAYGFRHPWRFSFDRETGDMWVADVGQALWEEVDIVVRGGNYGWRNFEGFHEYDNELNLSISDTEQPYLEYFHDIYHGRSITGANIYRGSSVPSLQGKLIFGDFVTGRVWSVSSTSSETPKPEEIGYVHYLDSFAEDSSGELLLISYEGTIWKISERDSDSTSNEIPTHLSDTGLFKDLTTLTPSAGLAQYDVRVPLWSDGAKKTRWIGVPEGEYIHFNSNEPWQFPVGTVFVKQFDLPTSASQYQRLETRVLFHHTEGWAGYTYKWNEAGTDADLVQNGEFKSVSYWNAETESAEARTWYIPGRVDCGRCHTSVMGSVLGVRTQEIDVEQIWRWDSMKFFDDTLPPVGTWSHLPKVMDVTNSLETRVKAYLDANCSQCHRPGGPTPAEMDFRFETAVSDMKTVDVLATRGDLGTENGKIVQPGNHEESVLWQRMNRLDEYRMPPLATHTVDHEALSLIETWIDSLD
jgi:uncharacterized repeat protein (TIGR03806 family)